MAVPVAVVVEGAITLLPMLALQIAAVAVVGVEV
jgi:hypothetical protein